MPSSIPSSPYPSSNTGDFSILKRDIDFRIGGCAAPLWCDNDEIKTAVFDAFSLFLPEGERFFIRSVHHYLDLVKDPRLLKDVKAFSAQESYHTREHELYNEALRCEGLPLDVVYQRIANLLGNVKGSLHRLAVTVGVEHLTACLGYAILKYPEILANSDPRYREIWTWHALEEIEHKAVAFEVFQVAAARLPKWKAYLLRCGSMLLATIDIFRMHFDLALELLRVRGYSPTWKTGLQLLWVMFGRPGFCRRITGYYLRFLKPGFFPSHGAEVPYALPWRQHFNERAASKGSHA
jgi:predicted metal-dependent hydrolase